MSVEANNLQWEQAPAEAKLPHDKRMDGVMARRYADHEAAKEARAELLRKRKFAELKASESPDMTKLPQECCDSDQMSAAQLYAHHQAGDFQPANREIANIRALVDELQLICQRMGETADRMEERLGQ